MDNTDNTLNFEKIMKPRYSDMIIEQIKDMIRSGKLVAGARLPTERELAEMLHVSRLPVREAIKALEATYVIENRQGDGYYIKNLSTDSLVQLFGEVYGAEKEDLVNDLHEARRIVEIASVTLACERRQDEDLQLMQNSIDEFEAAVQQRRISDMISMSMDFHNNIVRATHNQLLDKMMGCISLALVMGRRLLINTNILQYERNIEEHKAILATIRDRDAELAQELMGKHLNAVM